VLKSEDHSLLTVTEVARLLHVHPNTLRRWSEEGSIVSYRINSRGDRRFKPGDVQDFLNKFNPYKEYERESNDNIASGKREIR
jgi:excisionase family DNA binding protein